MIDKNLVENITNEAIQSLQRDDIFVVQIKVSKNNVIEVSIDGDNGVKVEDCIELSRYIDKHLDRDKEDFELTVMSFGLEEYFTMKRQFKKNIGQDIELIDKEGEKHNGVLAEVDEKGIVLTTKKDKQGKAFSFEDIDKAKVIINFKKK